MAYVADRMHGGCIHSNVRKIPICAAVADRMHGGCIHSLLGR